MRYHARFEPDGRGLASAYQPDWLATSSPLPATTSGTARRVFDRPEGSPSTILRRAVRVASTAFPRRMNHARSRRNCLEVDPGLKDGAAIVTRSSRGIARAIALSLAEGDCCVTVCARHEEELNQPGRPTRCRREAWTRWRWWRISSGWRRCAALSRRRRFSTDTSDPQFHGTLDLHLFAAIRAVWLVVPQMVRQAGGSYRQRRIHLGPRGGGTTAYNQAKAAEISLAKQAWCRTVGV